MTFYLFILLLFIFFKKVDQWKAKKRGDHKEVMKRARKAAELRQVIMYVKHDTNTANTL